MVRILGTDFVADFGADFDPDFFINEITLKFTGVTFFEFSKLKSFLVHIFIKIRIKMNRPGI